MADGPPVSVGFTWGAAGSWGTFIVALIGLIGLVLKQIGPWRKQTTDAETQLRKEMGETIDRLEAKIEKLERARETDRLKYEAERSLDRHKINNLSHCLDSVFLMLETAPERITEIAAGIKEVRAKQLEQEAIESAKLRSDAVKRVEGA